MESFTELNYDVADGVAWIVFNRPDKLNAWTPTLEQELRQAIKLSEEDNDVRCVVLTGAGRAFCAGMDMAVLQTPVSSDRRAQTLSEEDEALRYGYLQTFSKPLIAAINGPASGVGLCLAVYCDIRYVTAQAKLSFPYARRGLAAEHGIAWLLPRLIGPMATADLLFTGRTFLGEQADRIGLAQLLPSEGFREEVSERALEIAKWTSPRSVSVIKRQLMQARYQTFGQATRLADQEIARCRETEDFKEGVAHFLEKREPRFTGR
jgi:enoyl-CoA hydratase/carnithine racemase